ncbi:MAG: PaaI family thioesterase [Acetobacteraceae bacterium]|nr:PaaI family thioesterase [Acetobacteraceae bacterium]
MDEPLAREAFEAALRTQSPGFGTFFLARLLDLDISYGTADCTVRMAVKDFMYNPQGSLHGGLIATVLDISMGHLLTHAAGVGMTLQMNTQYIKPARAGIVQAHATFLRRGRSINYLESRMTDAEGGLMAAATSIWRLLEGK